MPCTNYHNGFSFSRGCVTHLKAKIHHYSSKSKSQLVTLIIISSQNNLMWARPFGLCQSISTRRKNSFSYCYLVLSSSLVDFSNPLGCRVIEFLVFHSLTHHAYISVTQTSEIMIISELVLYKDNCFRHLDGASANLYSCLPLRNLMMLKCNYEMK